MIHCLGDSHRDIFWEINQFLGKNIFSVYNIKSTLAYNLAYEDHIGNILINDCLNYIDSDYNSKLLMIFGEVDCRCHIVKQANLQEISLEESTEKVVDNYIVGLKRIVNKGYNVNVWGPIASMNDKYLEVFKHDILPHTGTNLQRNYITKLFNDYLKDKCKDLNIKVISIFDKLLNEDGTTNEKYYKDDKVHLGLNSIHIIMNSLNDIII